MGRGDVIGYIFEMAQIKKELESTRKALKYALSYIEKTQGHKVTHNDVNHVFSVVQEIQHK